MLAVCVALVALALRVLLTRRSGLWIDEAQLIWTARIPDVREMLQFVSLHDSHPPLFYLLMRGWLRLFGDSEAAALAPGLTLGVAVVLALYWMGARAFSPHTGLIAATLAACSPLLAWHAAEARPYSLMALLCLTSTFALWCALRDLPERRLGGQRASPAGPRLGPWAVYVATTAAMLWTHHWAWLVWGGQGFVAFAWWASRRGRGTGGHARWVAGAVAQLVIAGAAAPLIPTLLYQAQHGGHGPASISPGLFTAVVSSMVFSFQDPAQDAVLLALFAAAALSALRTALRARARARAGDPPDPATAGRALAMMLFVGGPLFAAALAAALSGRNNLLVPHTLVMVSPCLILGVAHVITTLSRWVPGRAPAVLRAAPAVLATALLAAAHLHILLKDRFVKSNAREVAAAVLARAAPTDLTLVVPQWYGSSFYYYYPLNRPRLDYPMEDFNGAFAYSDVARRMVAPDDFAVLKQRLAEARRGGRRIWLVTDRRWVDLSEGTGLPEHVLPGSYREAAFSRAAEIRRELRALYGAPELGVLPLDGRPGWSMMHVLLYSASQPALPDAR